MMPAAMTVAARMARPIVVVLVVAVQAAAATGARAIDEGLLRIGR
jgi:hypothetical protein